MHENTGLTFSSTNDAASKGSFNDNESYDKVKFQSSSKFAIDCNGGKENALSILAAVVSDEVKSLKNCDSSEETESKIKTSVSIPPNIEHYLDQEDEILVQDYVSFVMKQLARCNYTGSNKPPGFVGLQCIHCPCRKFFWSR